MIDRPTARVILLDHEGRVLLFQLADPNVAEPDSPHESLRRGLFWCTPGGGVEPGETHEEAARRELWKETGITNVQLGPRVFTREKTWTFPTPPSSTSANATSSPVPQTPPSPSPTTPTSNAAPTAPTAGGPSPTSTLPPRLSSQTAPPTSCAIAVPVLPSPSPSFRACRGICLSLETPPREGKCFDKLGMTGGAVHLAPLQSHLRRGLISADELRGPNAAE
ncbi:MAG: NUDIX domain-containing protein [Thermomicrobiales bacterium]